MVRPRIRTKFEHERLGAKYSLIADFKGFSKDSVRRRYEVEYLIEKFIFGYYRLNWRIKLYKKYIC